MDVYFTIDIGGTNVKYALINSRIEMFESGMFSTPKNSLFELVKSIKAIFDSYSNKYNIIGVPISSPGSVNSIIGTVGGVSAIPYIHGPNIKQTIEDELGVRTSIENDANCIALAEIWKGSAKEYEDSLIVVFGTGIGGAFIKNKKIHKGANLQAGEFGLMYFQNVNSKLTTWSENASTRALVELSGKSSGKEVFNLFDENDEEMIEVVNAWLMNIAIGLFSLQASYDPEIIIIGGGVSDRADLLSHLNLRIAEIANSIDGDAIVPTLRISSFKSNANLYGALYHFLESEKEN